MKSTKYVLAACAIASLSGVVAVRASADPVPLRAIAGISYQRAESDPLRGVGGVIAFASTAGPSHVERIDFVPVDRLISDDSDYRTLYVLDVDAAGDTNAAPIYTGTTASVAAGGSGDWEAGVAAFSAVISYDLPAGHSLAGVWRPEGGGVAHPGGYWRVE